MDANTETLTISAMRERLLDRAAQDEAFRARLLAEPKAAVQDTLGVQVPDGFTIEVHEEGPRTGHLVLPPPSDLSKAELDQVAAGAFDWSFPGL